MAGTTYYVVYTYTPDQNWNRAAEGWDTPALPAITYAQTGEPTYVYQLDSASGNWSGHWYLSKPDQITAVRASPPPVPSLPPSKKSDGKGVFIGTMAIVGGLAVAWFIYATVAEKRERKNPERDVEETMNMLRYYVKHIGHRHLETAVPVGAGIWRLGIVDNRGRRRIITAPDVEVERVWRTRGLNEESRRVISGKPPPPGLHRMTWDEVVAALRPHIGQRVRLTYPNGWQLVGVVGTMKDPIDGNEYVTLDGQVAGGELEGAVIVEVMGPSGRYEPVVHENPRAVVVESRIVNEGRRRRFPLRWVGDPEKGPSSAKGLKGIWRTIPPTKKSAGRWGLTLQHIATKEVESFGVFSDREMAEVFAERWERAERDGRHRLARMHNCEHGRSLLVPGEHAINCPFRPRVMVTPAQAAGSFHSTEAGYDAGYATGLAAAQQVWPPIVPQSWR